MGRHQPGVIPEEGDIEPESGLTFWTDAASLKILAHPLRQRAFNEAVKAPVSAKELAQRLGVPLQRMSYHVRLLADAGLLRVVRRTQRRGAMETHYRAIATIDMSTELFDNNPELQDLWCRFFLDLIREDFDHAIEEHDAPRSRDSRVVRGNLQVDAEGIERIRRLCDEFYDRLIEIEAEHRVDEPEQGKALNVVLLNYEGVWAGGRNSPMYFSLDADENTPLIPPP
jgi:DNA-binding transcriptional ArsR family regulator